MPISPVSLMTTPIQPTNEKVTLSVATPYEAQQSFATALKDAISNVNGLQKASDVATNKLINGENIELHEVMIASQKASITLNATMEVRNKVIEAYQEIMRMSV